MITRNTIIRRPNQISDTSSNDADPNSQLKMIVLYYGRDLLRRFHETLSNTYTERMQDDKKREMHEKHMVVIEPSVLTKASFLLQKFYSKSSIEEYNCYEISLACYTICLKLQDSYKYYSFAYTTLYECYLKVINSCIYGNNNICSPSESECTLFKQRIQYYEYIVLHTIDFDLNINVLSDILLHIFNTSFPNNPVFRRNDFKEFFQEFERILLSTPLCLKYTNKQLCCTLAYMYALRIKSEGIECRENWIQLLGTSEKKLICISQEWEQYSTLLKSTIPNYPYIKVQDYLYSTKNRSVNNKSVSCLPLPMHTRKIQEVNTKKNEIQVVSCPFNSSLLEIDFSYVPPCEMNSNLSGIIRNSKRSQRPIRNSNFNIYNLFDETPNKKTDTNEINNNKNTQENEGVKRSISMPVPSRDVLLEDPKMTLTLSSTSKPVASNTNDIKPLTTQYHSFSQPLQRPSTSLDLESKVIRRHVLKPVNVESKVVSRRIPTSLNASSSSSDVKNILTPVNICQSDTFLESTKNDCCASTSQVLPNERSIVLNHSNSNVVDKNTGVILGVSPIRLHNNPIDVKQLPSRTTTVINNEQLSSPVQPIKRRSVLEPVLTTGSHESVLSSYQPIKRRVL